MEEASKAQEGKIFHFPPRPFPHALALASLSMMMIRRSTRRKRRMSRRWKRMRKSKRKRERRRRSKKRLR